MLLYKQYLINLIRSKKKKEKKRKKEDIRILLNTQKFKKIHESPKSASKFFPEEKREIHWREKSQT